MIIFRIFKSEIYIFDSSIAFPYSTTSVVCIALCPFRLDTNHIEFHKAVGSELCSESLEYRFTQLEVVDGRHTCSLAIASKGSFLKSRIM